MKSARVIVWDHREQPDMALINQAVLDVFDGSHCPSLMLVETGSDEYALVVTPEAEPPERAQQLYEMWSLAEEADI